MSLVVFASAKGSPGVTQAVLGLAPVWDGPAVVADLDPAGGDLAYLRDSDDETPLATDRGLLSLGVALRGGKSSPLEEHLQRTEDGLDVLAGVAGPGQVQGLGAVWPHIGSALAGHTSDVLADCGRLTPGSPVWPVVERADAVVLVVRSEVAPVAHLRERLGWLTGVLAAGTTAAMPLGVLLVGDPSDGASAADLERLLAASGRPVPVLGVLALDPKAVRGPAQVSDRQLRRSLYRRSAVDVVPRLRELIGSEPPVLSPPVPVAIVDPAAAPPPSAGPAAATPVAASPAPSPPLIAPGPPMAPPPGNIPAPRDLSSPEAGRQRPVHDIPAPPGPPSPGGGH